MASTTAPTLSSIISPVATVLSASMATSVTTAIQEFSADAFNLVGQEAEDFGNFIDNMAMDVETGMTWSAAWAKESATFIAAEKSQLYQDAMTIIKQAVSIFDSWLAPVKAALGTL